MSPDLIIVVIGMLLFVLILIGVLVVGLRKTPISPLRVFRPFKIGYKHLTNTDENPVLSDVILADSQLFLVEQANISGYPYTVMANKDSTTMIFVQLPKSVSTHIVAVGNKSGWTVGINKLRLEKYLTPLSLEGNYSNYISMFCTKGRELELLQLFDPADMAYFMDYCKAYNFEVYKDSVYISQASKAIDTTDNTLMIKDVKEFMDRNEKLLSRM